MKSDTWLKDAKVKEWFALIGNERTIQNYTWEFPKFLEFVKANTEYKTPSQIIESRIEQLTSKDMNVKRIWESTVIKYMHYLEKQNIRMNTIKSYLRTVLSFFSKNHVKLEYSRGELLGSVQPSAKDMVMKEWIPSNEEVRLLYRLCDSARDRAILLVLYQSGFSEVDVSQMRVEDFQFYDQNSNWQLKLNEDLFHQRRREKTNIWQKTCLSREALEEIRIYLQSRGFPKEGNLFLTFKNEPMTVRAINDMLKAVVEKTFNGKVKEWQTKHLRDAFMNGLLQAKLPQELKDSMVGHKREGARESYALTEQTIKQSYADAFKFLTINGFGQQARKIEDLEDKFNIQIKAFTETLAELRTENKKLHVQLSEYQTENTKAMKKIVSDIDERLSPIERKLNIRKPFVFGKRDET
jgi:site-specific recombinase XerD